MTIKQLVVLLVIIVGVCWLSLWVFKGFNRHQVADTLSNQTKKKSEIFLPISTKRLIFGSLSSLEIEIEGRQFAVDLDLGYTGEASVTNKIIRELKDKHFKGVTTVRGLRGNRHQKNVYQIPQLHIGHLTFSPITLEEENEQMQEEGVIRGSDPEFFVPLSLGKVGWKLFRNSVLFLDLGQSKMIIGDTIETFQNQGYSFKEFIKVPLLIDRGFVEIETFTSKGPLRCFLDTGCTFNLIPVENKQEETLGKIIMNKELSLRSTKFQIGDKDFGEIVFHPFPIQFHVPIEAILGMEFFSRHQVLLDFRNREIYVSSSTNTERP